MPFKKGHKQIGGIQKGQKQQKTLVKINLGEKIAELDGKLYEVAETLLNDKKTSGFAMKELLKYRLPQKKEVELTTDKDIVVKLIPELEDNAG
jgi:hypothetical protein